MKICEGFIYVFDIKQNKMDELYEFIEDVLKVKEVDYFPLVIFFNKSDLQEDQIQIKENDTNEIIKNVKTKYFCHISHFYGSAKTGNFVIEAFYEVIYAINHFHYKFDAPMK